MTQQNLPKHIAIIMDGNGRWAKQHGHTRISGHKAGVDSVREIVESCARKGIEVLTLFTFSSENWSRPREEVSALMDLLLRALQREVEKIHKNNIRIRFIGDLTRFSKKLHDHMQKTMELTKNNSGMTLVIALNYGGRWDISKALQELTSRVLDGELKVEDINNQDISNALSTSGLPDPDLFIRTSGEMRISNFLLWQLAYTEMYFTDTYWPDFKTLELEKALEVYSKRQRRFGMTSEQQGEMTSA